MLGVSLNEQNPKLTNIVLARQELTRDDGVPVKAQFTGGLSREPLSREGKPQEITSLQVENFQNVDILAGAFKQFGSASHHTDGTQIANHERGDIHDYDTHNRDNIENGVKTRERVNKVYTLRYEYKQPWVDYPYDQARTTQPSSPGYLPTASDIIGEAHNVTGNTFKYDEMRKSSHAANNGLGSIQAGEQANQYRYAFGHIVNNEQLYGSHDGAVGYWSPVSKRGDAPANAWKNLHTDNTPVQIGRNTSIVNGVRLYDSPTTLDWTRSIYAAGAYPEYIQNTPMYPNIPYDVSTRGAWQPGNGKTHMHSYLEEDDFTAIRQLKSTRPLVNPVADTWLWQLYEMWTYQEASVDANGVVTWTNKTSNGLHGSAYGGTSSNIDITGAAVSSGSTRNWTLVNRWWITTGPNAPVNQKDGVQGEFRGPSYDGWNEGADTIRYSDPRIWDKTHAGYKAEYERKYGGNLIWWTTQDSAFENWATRFGWDPRARRVDNNTHADPEDLVYSQARDGDIEIQPTGDITNGLIRIGGDRRLLGQELRWDDNAKVWVDHHNTKTRIFGHYHLAYADQNKGGENKPVTFNSYQGARSFVARVKSGTYKTDTTGELDIITGRTNKAYADLDADPELYSIGAMPMTLEKVQYGRVTTKLDIDDGEGPFNGDFLRAPLTYKNDPTGVDNYFFRGVDETTIEEMAALANNGAARYEGHALMYGIDNRYHGINSISNKTPTNLPNAFAIDSASGSDGPSNALGLGNFVQADVDFGTKKVSGQVYNLWLLDPTKSAVTKDLLVDFKGDIMGNTVIGTADRTYATGDDKADFRAAFFGAQAEEMGGAFNSVTREQKYGSAYEDGDWGGVFGAKKVGGNSNTFQGDDGNNVYNTGL